MYFLSSSAFHDESLLDQKEKILIPDDQCYILNIIFQYRMQHCRRQPCYNGEFGKENFAYICRRRPQDEGRVCSAEGEGGKCLPGTSQRRRIPTSKNFLEAQ